MQKPATNDTQVKDGRRDFLKGVVTVGGAATVALAAGGAAAAGATETTRAATRSPGYRLTDHIKDYYKTAGM